MLDQSYQICVNQVFSKGPLLALRGRLLDNLLYYYSILYLNNIFPIHHNYDRGKNSDYHSVLLGNIMNMCSSIVGRFSVVTEQASSSPTVPLDVVGFDYGVLLYGNGSVDQYVQMLCSSFVTHEQD